ncbi:MAG: methyl-accepting chemotaxis protein, partial [Lachnospiraceae bacterium]|nr:methyl-accepting chemotaxis protein [Lachnospiraceae bacterium]
MKTLKKTISQYMLRITGTLMIAILAVIVCLQIIVERYREFESSLGVLAQIKQFVEENVVEEDTTEAMGKKEYSNLFSLIRVNSDANYYVISGDEGVIVGSTDKEALGVDCEEKGLTLKKVTTNKYGFFSKIDGERYFCVFQQIGDDYVGRCVESSKMFQRVPTTAVLLVLCLATIAWILTNVVSRYMNRYVVDGIHQINDELSRISEGDMDVKVDIRTSEEFSELSDYINTMVSSLSDTTSKISYVLSKTNMFIGVYEYRKGARPVHCTEYIPRIFSMELEEWRLLTSDYELFNEYIENVRTKPFDEEQGVYMLSEEPEQYVK